MAKAKIGGGDVPVILDGRELLLKPSLDACIQISRMGAINDVFARLRAMHFETICQVIGIGLGANPRQREKDIPEAVYNAGIFAISAVAMEFVHVIANGGRREDDDEDAGGGPAGDSPLDASST
jgi:hypothetical protein